MLKTTSIAAAIAAATLLAGCLVISVDEHHSPSARALPEGGAEVCDADAYKPLVGQAEDEIDRSRLPRTFRIVCHECQVTMDYNPNRLNVQLDAQNRVASVSCG